MTRRAIRGGLAAIALSASGSLAGCARGVLDPAGPVARGERTILLDSLAIMLAIVLPTIAATLAFAFWYRARNKRAAYDPDFEYSGPHRARHLVDPGDDGDAAGGCRLDRLARIRSVQAARVQGTARAGAGGRARLEMAVHLPAGGRGERRSAGRAGGAAGELPDHLGHGDEQLPRPAARRPDLRHARHDQPPEPAGGCAGRVPRPVGALQRRRLRAHGLSRSGQVGARLPRLGRHRPRGAPAGRRRLCWAGATLDDQGPPRLRRPRARAFPSGSPQARRRPRRRLRSAPAVARRRRRDAARQALLGVDPLRRTDRDGHGGGCCSSASRQCSR